MSENKHCVRCGEGPDEDLRTLWMACFYKMAELTEVPLKEVALTATEFYEAIGEEQMTGVGFPLKQTIWSEPKVFEKPQRHGFYTMEVCKGCRADWMSAIQHWYSNAPGKKDILGSGIFVRRNGATVEITEEEWYRTNPDREPVRVKNA